MTAVSTIVVVVGSEDIRASRIFQLDWVVDTLQAHISSRLRGGQRGMGHETWNLLNTFVQKKHIMLVSAITFTYWDPLRVLHQKVTMSQHCRSSCEAKDGNRSHLFIKIIIAISLWEQVVMPPLAFGKVHDSCGDLCGLNDPYATSMRIVTSTNPSGNK